MADVVLTEKLFSSAISEGLRRSIVDSAKNAVIVDKLVAMLESRNYRVASYKGCWAIFKNSRMIHEEKTFELSLLWAVDNLLIIKTEGALDGKQ